MNNYRKEDIVNLYLSDKRLTTYKVGSLLGIPPYKVLNVLRKEGVYDSTRKIAVKTVISNLTEEDIEIIRDMYINKTRKDIAEFLDLHYNSVGHVLKYLKINSRKQQFDKNYDKALKGVYFNPFIDINKDSAYLLGYILGDGCIRYRTKITPYIDISSKDYHIIESFRKLLKAENKNIATLTKDKHVWYSFRIHDLAIAKSLESFGIIPNKSAKGCYNIVIPKGYENHYIRGLFDSDGCVRINQNRLNVDIMGHPSYIDRFIEQDYKHFKFHRVPIKGKYIINMSIYKIQTIKEFYNYIYPSEDILYLYRKKEIFDNHYEQRDYTLPRNCHNKGKVMTRDQRIRLSRSKLKSKIINLDTGEIFDNLIEPSEKYNIGTSNICAVCSTTIKKPREFAGGYRWAYYKDNID